MSSVGKSTIEDLQKKDSTLRKCFAGVGKLIIRENYVGEFFMKNGLNYRKHQETKTGRISNQLVVPKQLRQQVMSVNHESPFSGHLGAKKTEVSILPNFFWPGLSQGDIRSCRSCDVCQSTIKKGTVRGRGSSTQEEAVSEALLDIYSGVEWVFLKFCCSYS